MFFPLYIIIFLLLFIIIIVVLLHKQTANTRKEESNHANRAYQQKQSIYNTYHTPTDNTLKYNCIMSNISLCNVLALLFAISIIPTVLGSDCTFSTSGSHSISVDCNLTNTIEVSSDLTIIGTKSDNALTMITRPGNGRHFYNNGHALTLKNLHLTGGVATSSPNPAYSSIQEAGIGGSIFMIQGNLIISNCFFSSNTACAGGAIFYYSRNNKGSCSGADKTTREACLGAGTCTDPSNTVVDVNKDACLQSGTCTCPGGADGPGNKGECEGRGGCSWTPTNTWTSAGLTWSLLSGEDYCGQVTIEDTKFSGNKAEICGNEQTQHFMLSDVSTTLVIDSGVGGAMYIGSTYDIAGTGSTSNNINVSKSVFSSNNAYLGGALYILEGKHWPGKDISFTDTVFSGNGPREYEYSNDGPFTQGGGAIAFVETAGIINEEAPPVTTLSFNRCKFVDNKADEKSKGSILLHISRKPSSATGDWKPILDLDQTTSVYQNSDPLAGMKTPDRRDFNSIGVNANLVTAADTSDGYTFQKIDSDYMFIHRFVKTCSSDFPSISSSILEIIAVSNSGIFTTKSTSEGNINGYATNDVVTIASCTDSDNNGNYQIGSISGNEITLVDKYTKAAIVTIESLDGMSCTIERAALEISSCTTSISEHLCCEATPEISGITLREGGTAVSTGTSLGGTFATITGINFKTPNTAVPNNVIAILSISAAGTYRTTDNSAVAGTGINSYAVDDIVIIEGCSHEDSLKNNGAFIISSISGNNITLIHKDTFGAIATGTNKAGCKIKNPNIVVTTNGVIWPYVEVDSGNTILYATTPSGLGANIPVKIAINGVMSKYDTIKFSYTLPNITAVPQIPKISGGSSSKVKINVVEFGTPAHVESLSIFIAAEGASACGGTACDNLNINAGQVPADDSVITISSVTTSGVYTTADGGNPPGPGIDNYHVNDIVVVAGCTDTNKNGEWKISTINGNDITLVHVDTGAAQSVSAQTDRGNCKIYKLAGVNDIICDYSAAGAKEACMDIVLAAGGQKSPPRTFCYGSEDEGAIIITKNAPDVTEGTSDSNYKLNLKDGVTRTQNVTVAITVNNTNDALPCTVSPTSVTFLISDTTDKTITITTSSNSVDEGTGYIVNQCTITHTISTTDPVYSLVDAESIKMNVTNDDNANVNLWYDKVYPVKFLAFYANEGDSVAYDIKLETEPVADVTVTIDINLNPLNDIEVAVGVITITSVTTNGVYTTADGSPAGTGISSYTVNDIVTIKSCSASTENNGFFKISAITGNEITLINRATNGAIVTGANHAGCTISKQRMHPSPTPSITPSSSELTFTSSNWDVYQTVTLTSADDKIEHDLSRFAILHTISTSDTVFQDKINALTTIKAIMDVGDNDDVGILHNANNVTLNLVSTDSNTDKEVKVTKLNSEPVADVKIVVEIQAGKDFLTVTPTFITISKTNWDQENTAFTFHSGAITGSDDNAIVTLRAESDDLKYNTLNAASFQFSITSNDDKGTLTGISTEIQEVVEKGSVSYDIKLSKSGRNETVTVDITATSSVPNLPCEVIPPSVTFAALPEADQNADAKSIIVKTSGNRIHDVNDPIAICLVTHSVTSSDALYSGISSQVLTVHVKNDDAADVKLWSINPTTQLPEYDVKFLSFYAEEGKSAMYALRLESQPTDDVYIATSIALDNNEFIPPPAPSIIAQPSSLLFTQQNWNIYQNISLISQSDNIVHELARFQVLHVVTTNDAIYAREVNTTTNSILAVIDVGDDDTTGIEVNLLDEDLTLVEDGNSKRVKVSRLTSQPVSDVTITATIPDEWANVVKVTPASVTIDEDQWDNVIANNIFTFNALTGATKSASLDIELQSDSDDVKYKLGSNKALVTAYVSTAADAPTTNITYSPPATSAERLAKFVFSTSKSDVVKFFYRLEGPTPIAKGELACPGGVCKAGKGVSFQTPMLDFGRHRIVVQAVTAANTQDPNGASHEWEISHCNDPNRVPSQYAKIEDNGALECIDCPHATGANCDVMDAEWEHIYANPEWWTSGSREDNYYLCPLKKACIGGVKASVNGTLTVEKYRCALGYAGTVCATCDEGYFLSEEQCIKCPEQKADANAVVVGTFSAIFIVFVLMLLNVMRVKTSKHHWNIMRASTIEKKKNRKLDRKTLKQMRIFSRFAATTLKTFIGYVQILSVSDTAFNIPWPKGFLSFLRILAPINLDFLSISGVGCVVKFDFYTSYVTMMAMPLLLLLFVVVAYSLGLRRHKVYFGKQFTPVMAKSYTNHVLQFTMWIVIIFYPPVSRRAIQYITCSEAIDGKHYLTQDYTLECFNEQWHTYFPYAMTALIVYPLGIPAFFAFKLWSRHDKLKDSNVHARYGFLYEMYRDENYWWDVYEMLQKLFLTGVIVLIFPGKTLQVVIVVLADLCFLMNLLIQKPHKEGPTRNLAMMANMACTLTMYCGLVLVSVPETGKQYSLLFDFILILMNGVVAVYAAIHISPFKLFFIYVAGRARIKRQQAEELEKKRRRSLLPSTDRAKVGHVARSFTTRNMSQIIPAQKAKKNHEQHEETEQNALRRDMVHEITDEDHHNTTINGVKGPHEL